MTPWRSSNGTARRGCGIHECVTNPRVMAQNDNAWLFFRVGSVPCALPATEVESVERALEVTPAVGVPRSVAGVTVVRGAVVPVLDLHWLFRQPTVPAEGCFLVIRSQDGTPVALRVSETEDIEHVEERRFQALRIPGSSSRFARKVIVRENGQLYLVLDPTRLVAKGQGATGRAA